MNKSLLAMLLLSLCASLTAYADIYKYRENGVIKYSDRPPINGAAAQTMEIKTNPPPAVTVKAPTAMSGEPTMGDAAKRSQNAEADKQKAQAAAEEQKMKEENCKNARTSVSNYQIGGRIYKVNEKGERVYMGDEEIKNSLARAEQDVAKYCN